MKSQGIPWYPLVSLGVSRDPKESHGTTVLPRYHAGIDGFINFDLCNFVFVFNLVQDHHKILYVIV